ncbi:MAG: hypothetical protein K5773_03405 [Pseudobutyrivibrio sp.]|nr:hypothetical protein [Pseudobutyrivibrio sp.]
MIINSSTYTNFAVAESESRIAVSVNEKSKEALESTSKKPIQNPENIRSISSDGDTLSVSDQSQERESLGYVTDTSSNLSQSKSESEYSNYAGVTDKELEDMYLQGDITKIEYDKEMLVRTEANASPDKEDKVTLISQDKDSEKTETEKEDINQTSPQKSTEEADTAKHEPAKAYEPVDMDYSTLEKMERLDYTNTINEKINKATEDPEETRFNYQITSNVTDVMRDLV